jgi:hypothetical protein
MAVSVPVSVGATIVARLDKRIAVYDRMVKACKAVYAAAPRESRAARDAMFAAAEEADRLRDFRCEIAKVWHLAA